MVTHSAGIRTVDLSPRNRLAAAVTANWLTERSNPIQISVLLNHKGE